MLAMERLPPTQSFLSPLSLSSPTLESQRVGTPLGLRSPMHSRPRPHLPPPPKLVIPRGSTSSLQTLPPYDTGLTTSTTPSLYSPQDGPSMLPVITSAESEHPLPDSANTMMSPGLPAPPTTISTPAVGTGGCTPPIKRESSSTSSCEGKCICHARTIAIHAVINNPYTSSRSLMMCAMAIMFLLSSSLIVNTVVLY